MTARIANRASIVPFAVAVFAVVLVQFAPSLALTPVPLGDAANQQGFEQDIDPLTMGLNECCRMSSDDWIYWDR
jgi:hypothetical protein